MDSDPLLFILFWVIAVILIAVVIFFVALMIAGLIFKGAVGITNAILGITPREDIYAPAVRLQPRVRPHLAQANTQHNQPNTQHNQPNAPQHNQANAQPNAQPNSARSSAESNPYSSPQQVDRRRYSDLPDSIPSPSLGKAMWIVFCNGLATFPVKLIAAGLNVVAPGAGLITLPILFLINAGITAGMLPTSFGRGSLVALFEWIISVLIGLALMAFLLLLYGPENLRPDP